VTYVGQSLGKRFGFFTAWSYFLYDPLIPTVSILIAAGFLEQVFREQLGVTLPWWITTLLCLALVHVVTYAGVKQSAKVNLWLGVAESTLLVALSLSVIVHVGTRGQSLTPFKFPLTGSHALFIGFAFALLLFCGFESAATLAEEARNLKTSIPRTMVASLLIVGAMWILAGYAMVVGFGLSNAQQMLQARENPFFSLAHEVWGPGWVLVVFALLNSSIAASIAGQNAGSRVIFALGRAGVLPSKLGYTHPTHHTPYIAILLQTALNIAVSMILGFWLGPIRALNFIGVLIAIVVIVIYVLANVAVILLFRKRYRQEWSTVKHLLVPLGAIALLGLALYYTVWPVPPSPLNVAEGFVAAWLLIGALFALFLRGRFRDALERAVSMMAGESSLRFQEPVNVDSQQ